MSTPTVAVAVADPAAPRYNAEGKRIRSAKFVVLQGAVTIRVGKSPDDTRRLVQGQVVELSNEFTNIGVLIRLKAIARVLEGTHQYKMTTAAEAAAAQGAIDDPVQRPDPEALPMIPDDALPPAIPATAPDHDAETAVDEAIIAEAMVPDDDDDL